MKTKSTVQELLDEFRLVLGKRAGIVDAALPPLLFLIANLLFGLAPAILTATVAALGFVLLRIFKRQALGGALTGLGLALLAAWLASSSGRAQDAYLPDLANALLTTAALALSILIRRPAVAFTSALTRGWPLAWYWHPRVRPAYAWVTALWAAFFGIKTAVQYALFQRGDMFIQLSYFNFFSGWPALVVLLAASYLLGQNLLHRLGGPSVEEFRTGAPPPWQGQARGF